MFFSFNKKDGISHREKKENEVLKRYGFTRSPYLHMTVHDDSNFLSPYSETDQPVISSEVAEFLDESALVFHHNEELTLEIKSDCIDDREKEVYTKAIKNYYTVRQAACERDLRRNTALSIAMTVVGVLSLAFMFVMDYIGVKDIWVECIDIFAWVFLWEAVDQYFIERKTLKIKRKRNEAFMNMKVKFTDIAKDE